MENENPNDRILSSWKEIAACLGKGVRTLQRWEELGLPVRRPHGKGTNVVIAVESELRAWMDEFLRTKQQDPVPFDLDRRLAHLEAELQNLGSVVTMLDQRLDAALSDATARKRTERPVKAISVLAVDDNEVHRYTIGKLLSASGFQVRLAKDGAEALSFTAESKPDVILLDVILPDISGFEVCSSLRSDVTTKNIPVIIHTAMEATDTAYDRALASGANAFVRYPVKREDLMTIINSCVAKGAA